MVNQPNIRAALEEGFIALAVIIMGLGLIIASPIWVPIWALGAIKIKLFGITPDTNMNSPGDFYGRH